ncbi:MAG: PorT family protein [Flavobacteriales bacterium]|jgi:opacity protein-like surface antigen|nr:PorT family protein [Flavobacteriales bacterium]
MKKALLILVAATLAAPTLHAQDDAGARFGIKLAPNMSWFKSDTKGIANDGSKIGFTFGLATEFPIGEAGNYRFATGLFLNTVGGKYLQSFTYTENNQVLTKDLSSDVGLQYIQVPLTMKLMTKEIGYMRYYGQLGFDACFNVRAKADFDQVSVDPANGGRITFIKLDDEDIKDNIQPIRAGLVVGAGMEYNFSGSTTLQVGVSYNNGLTNLLKKVEVVDANGAVKKAKMLQNYLELNLAIFF